MSEKIYAYKWTVDGFDVETPDAESHPIRQYIDMPRGCIAGTAKFYLRAEDAKTLIGKTSVDIVAEIHTRNVDKSDEWEIEKTLTWSEYIPVEVAEADQSGGSMVTLKDKRHKLDRKVEGKIWNQVRYVTEPASGVETITHERLYLNGGSPYTYQDIVDELCGDLPAPTLPSGGDGEPNNLFCNGSVAEFLDGLFASLGVAMAIDLAGAVTLVDVSDNELPEALTEARKDRRIAMVDADIAKHGKVVMWPSMYYPYHPKSSTEVFGEGADLREVHIIDHELSDKNDGMDGDRKTAIMEAVEAWYTAERNMYDETFYGLLDVTPGPGVVHTTWSLNAPGLGHHTRVRNYSPPIPWPTRFEAPPPTPLWGLTDTTIASDSTGEVKIDDPVVGGMWTTTAKRQFVYNRGPAITSGKRVILFPMDDRWCVVEVC